MFSLESPRRGDSTEYTYYTIFNMKKEKHPKLSQSSYGFFKESQERVRNSRGKITSSFRAIEVLLYIFNQQFYIQLIL